jgi:hypothetical protein
MPTQSYGHFLKYGLRGGGMAAILNLFLFEINLRFFGVNFNVVMGVRAQNITEIQIIFVINPNKQFSNLKNAQNRADMNTILYAVYQYIIDNNGILPTAITTTQTEIYETSRSFSGLIDSSVLTASEKYLPSMPKHQNDTCNAESVSNEILKSVNDRVTGVAPDAEHFVINSVTC